jgi:hypothetical protein
MLPGTIRASEKPRATKQIRANDAALEMTQLMENEMPALIGQCLRDGFKSTVKKLNETEKQFSHCLALLVSSFSAA